MNIQKRGKKNGSIIVGVVIILLSITYLPQLRAYEPVIYKKDANLGIGGLCDVYGINSSSCFYEDLGENGFLEGMDSVVFSWDYEFFPDSDDCKDTLHRGMLVFEANAGGPIEIVTSPGDTLRLESYKLFFNPKKGMLTLGTTSRPTIGGTNETTMLDTEMPLMDTFRSAYSSGNPFCRYDDPSLSQVRFDLYLNAYNSFVVVSAPQDPMGRTLSTPIRIGLGRYLMEKLAGTEGGVNLSFKNTSDSRMVPHYLPKRISAHQFYWTSKKGSPYTHPSRRNITDDINLNYGAKAYPVRSPVLERTNAAAAIAVLF